MRGSNTSVPSAVQAVFSLNLSLRLHCSRRLRSFSCPSATSSCHPSPFWPLWTHQLNFLTQLLDSSAFPRGSHIPRWQMTCSAGLPSVLRAANNSIKFSYQVSESHYEVMITSVNNCSYSSLVVQYVQNIEWGKHHLLPAKVYNEASQNSIKKDIGPNARANCMNRFVLQWYTWVTFSTWGKTVFSLKNYNVLIWINREIKGSNQQK